MIGNLNSPEGAPQARSAGLDSWGPGNTLEPLVGYKGGAPVGSKRQIPESSGNFSFLELRKSAPVTL